MSGSLRLRLFHASDLPFADSLRALAGWNQAMADWERFLAFSPHGCFLAEWEQVSAGVVTTITYGSELGWIGMALVHPDYRRRGIGRALLEHAIEHLQNRGIPLIKLDATPQGLANYLKLGFKEESSLTRWEGELNLAAPAESDRWNLNSIQNLDEIAFGVPRLGLLDSLARASHPIICRDSRGYGMIRPGSRAFYLGPVVAPTAEMGLAIVNDLVATTAGRRIFWDIFDRNIPLSDWAQERGFTQQRQLTRMFLGERNITGLTSMQIAIGGPELG